jgi:hypothetical protein
MARPVHNRMCPLKPAPNKGSAKGVSKVRVTGKIDTESVMRANRAYHRSGFESVGKALSSIHRLRGDAWIESLGKTGEVLREWRAAIITDLGGEETISAQERAVVELATRTYLLLESVDRYLLGLPSLVNKRRRQLFAVVLQRQQLADALARYLGQLGLERRTRELPSLAVIAREYAEEKDEHKRNEVNEISRQAKP